MKKKDILKKCITLYGDINISSEELKELYNYSKQLIVDIGYIPNYIGVISNSFKSGKIVSLKRSEKKLLESIKKEEVNSMEILALPDEFKIASFDYNVSILICKNFNPNHITIAIREKEEKLNFDTNKIIENFKKYLKFNEGEVYEMSVRDDQLSYILNKRDPLKYKNMRIIQNIK